MNIIIISVRFRKTLLKKEKSVNRITQNSNSIHITRIYDLQNQHSDAGVVITRQSRSLCIHGSYYEGRNVATSFNINPNI